MLLRPQALQHFLKGMMIKLYQKGAEMQAITLEQIDIYLKGVRI